MEIQSGWRMPDGQWSLKHGGLVLIPLQILGVGIDYNVNVFTLCGEDNADLDAAPKAVMPAYEFVRRVQLVASMHHVMRRNCAKCRDAYQSKLTPQEKQWLYSENPQLGPILGMDVTEFDPAHVAPKDESRFNEVHGKASAAVQRLLQRQRATGG